MSAEQRRFSDRERVALYLAADGKCSRCGKELGPGWHADHVTPYVAGGATDVVNGQALCPDCNLHKGSGMARKPRIWQKRALDRMLETTDDFLVVACPGAGKTEFALTAAAELRRRNEVERVIVVVPTTHLRKQWAKEAVRWGIRLNHKFGNADGALQDDKDGATVTYAGVASLPELYRHLSAQRPTLVILDEVHHGGKELPWGNAFKQAFGGAARRLLLSGTPSRADRRPVPFVHYDEDGKFVAEGGHGYTYGYGDGIRDGVVRPIEFLALDGRMRWTDAGKVITQDLLEADDSTLASALKSALWPKGEWIKSVLQQADRELTRHRVDVPDAAGLVVASNQEDAKAYRDHLKGITGEEPVLAISDEVDSSERITRFADSTSRWLVAVQMVSEGVDIPRLAVGVYATNIRDSETFFRQVVGRFVRMRGEDDATVATLLIPSIEPLLRYAHAIERIVDMGLRATPERKAPSLDPAPLRLDFTDPLSSSEADHYASILSGDTFTPEELSHVRDVASAAGVSQSVSLTQLAKFARMLGGLQTPPASPPPTMEHVSLPEDETLALRRAINKKVAELSRLTQRPHSHFHAELNRLYGDRPKTATEENLKRRLEILAEWRKEFHESDRSE